MRKRTPPHSIVCCRRWRFAVHAVRLVLDCSKAIVGFLCARVNAVPVRSSPPIRLAMLTSAWRAARHRERERIKSDVGLAEEGKRIGRPTISRRLRERQSALPRARRPLASPRISFSGDRPISLCNESTRSINVARSGAPKYLAERLIGTVRRDCLDRLLIFG